jgi:hypothetical protein
MATTVNVNSMPQVDVDVNDLPPVDVDVTNLPDFSITAIGPMGPMTLNGIPSSYNVAIDSLPDLNLRIKEIPQVRAHVPANFRLGLSILGMELAALHLCGEAQVITEPYQPNPCERCGPSRLVYEPREAIGAVLHLKDAK